jgi:hypothetical protein
MPASLRRGSTRSARATGSFTSVAARFRPLAPVGGTMWRGVAGQEQAAEAHRLGDEAAQRRDALLDRLGPVTSRARRPRVQAAAQLVPEGVVAPVLDLVVSGTCR